ncbi:MAG: hydroxymethylbilane synthase [Pseudomonadales bacterium]|jgi:hydroxymethylbilane synthase|nr:hydroxymethylbilane synthase [Pseudomonadales bacterium]
MKNIRIATRESALALWQANHVKALLESAHADVTCEIVGMTTEGDRNKVSPLSQMGGKGVFVKELETALLDGSVDIAVHSMKDVPGELPGGLEIAAMVERADPRDAFVSNDFTGLAELPDGARVGSSSLRRVLQLKAAFPGLQFLELRGNVDTRLRKLDEGQYEAIILAVAGLTRLGLAERVADAISTDISIPAAGQGAVGIECRSDDRVTRALLDAINHKATWQCVGAEREVTLMLGATCNLPIAVFAEIVDSTLAITGYVSDISGVQVVRESLQGPAANAKHLARELGTRLLEQGAAELIGSV